MLKTNLIASFITSFIGLTLTTAVDADIIECGNSKVIYSTSVPTPYGHETIALSIESKSNNYTRNYSWKHFYITCKDEKYVVFKAFCSGSACDDNSNIGIVDAINGKPLLEPEDGNRKDALRIISKIPKSIEQL